MARHYRYISADSHFESPPEQWTHRVPKQYRERAPRRIKLANGRDGLLFEGSRLVYGGTSLYGGRGSIWGTIAGAFFIGILNNGLNLYNVSAYDQMIVKGAVFLLAASLDRWRTT